MALVIAVYLLLSSSISASLEDLSSTSLAAESSTVSDYSFTRNCDDDSSLICDEGWLLIDCTCYFLGEYKFVYFWSRPQSISTCWERYGATLPIIHTANQNQQLLDAVMARVQNPEADLFACGLFFWIGLSCDESNGNEHYTWQDGSAFDYHNFTEPMGYCQVYQACWPGYSLTAHGWQSLDEYDPPLILACSKPATQRDSSVSTEYTTDSFTSSTRRLLTATPPLNDCDDSSLFCDEGWTMIECACFFIGQHEVYTRYTYRDSYELCRSIGGTLPSIHSDHMNRELLALTRAATQETSFYCRRDVFWIGISCNGTLGEQENSTFWWQDGSEFDYQHFNIRGATSGCGFPLPYVFVRNGKWDFEPRYYRGACLQVCSKAASRVTTTTTGLINEITTTGMKTTSTVTFSTSTVKLSTTSSGNGGMPTWSIVIIVISIILIIIVLISFSVFLYRRRIHSLQADFVEAQMEGDKHDAKNATTTDQENRYYDVRELGESDQWEIERRFVGVDYMQKLGEGAFGSVYLGRILAKNIPLGMGRSVAQLYALTNDNEAVAVKVLHETADAAAECEFRYEIELMKRIGYYERLVNILACVTTIDPILLVTEYCSNGDLLGFMRQRRVHMLENTDEIDESKIITARTQILFAIQIAYGMEYLSTQGFVHRDLAARNVMVDQNETCKIGDFGLCREIGKVEENYYSQGGKLPLKWMSPEAIEKYKFSVASDVWSYGIVLFEIVTLGGSPYAGWLAGEILNRLQSGDRMEKPEICSEHLFKLMSHCWAEQPADRPNFTELRNTLTVLLDEVQTNDYYLKLNADANYYVMESNANDFHF